jgi:hypothetical protein
MDYLWELEVDVKVILKWIPGKVCESKGRSKLFQDGVRTVHLYAVYYNRLENSGR